MVTKTLFKTEKQPVQDELGQIKDILLGADISRLDQELVHLDDRYRQKIEALESAWVSKLEAVRKTQTEALETERAARKELLDRTEGALAQLSNSLDTAIRTLADNGAQDLAALKTTLETTLETKIGTLERDLNARHDTANERTEQSIAKLRLGKADAAKLSGLFTELAAQLCTDDGS